MRLKLEPADEVDGGRAGVAVVDAAVGTRAEAAAKLGEAVRPDPELERSDEVKLLRARLGR